MVPNVGYAFIGSFSFSFFPAFPQAFTLAVATFSIAAWAPLAAKESGSGAPLEGGKEDTTDGRAAAIGSLPWRLLRRSWVNTGASGASLIYFSSAPLAWCSPRQTVVSTTTVSSLPLRDIALEGPATGPAVGWDLIGKVLALSVTDGRDIAQYAVDFLCFSLARV